MNAKRTELENGCFKLEPQEKYNLGNVYYYNSKYEIHRAGGPAIEASNCSKYWYLNGKCHRTDGPACEYANGRKEWYLNGELHRIDGPAVEYADGSKEWWINGKEYTEEDFNEVKEVLWAI